MIAYASKHECGSMPLYYFDMADGEMFHDEDGLEFKDDQAAQHQAMRAIADYAADVSSGGDGCQVFTILVSNANREAIYSATLTLSGGPIRPGR